MIRRRLSSQPLSPGGGVGLGGEESLKRQYRRTVTCRLGFGSYAAEIVSFVLFFSRNVPRQSRCLVSFRPCVCRYCRLSVEITIVRNPSSVRSQGRTSAWERMRGMMKSGRVIVVDGGEGLRSRSCCSVVTPPTRDSSVRREIEERESEPDGGKGER